MRLITASRPVETNPLHPDEPCFALCELNLHPETGKDLRRYQLVCVVRNDRKKWIRIDMGLASDWPSADQFRVVADGDDDTVARCQEIADGIRDDMYWRKFLEEEQQASTLITDHIHWAEEAIKRKARISTHGPNFRKERN